MSPFQKVAVLTLASVFMINCGGSGDGQPAELPGEDVTSSFLDDFSGLFVEQDGDEFVQFSEDGSIVVNRVRQVGSDESKTVPYETVCTFILRGKISAIFKLHDNYRTRTNITNGETYMNPETHRVDFDVSEVEWNKAADANNPKSKNCDNFEKESNASPGRYSLGTEILSGDQLRFHTSGGGDYVGQSDGTPSIRDEVFNRQ